MWINTCAKKRRLGEICWEERKRSLVDMNVRPTTVLCDCDGKMAN